MDTGNRRGISGAASRILTGRISLTPASLALLLHAGSGHCLGFALQALGGEVRDKRVDDGLKACLP